LDQGAFGKCAFAARRGSRVGGVLLIETLLVERLRRLRRVDVVGSDPLYFATRQRI
jgi:hypothetical protein